MKLLLFTDHQLRTAVQQNLLPEYVKSFFFKMLEYNNLRLTEYVSSIFNLNYIPHYSQISPASLEMYTCGQVISQFERLQSKLQETDIFQIYGIDPLDAIYRHCGHTGEYDGFSGNFHEDLYSLMSTVDPDQCADYFSDITTLVRCLIEFIERHYIEYHNDHLCVYVTVSSTPDHLTVLAECSPK